MSVVEYLVWLEYDRDLQAMKARHQTAVGLVRAKLETEVNSTMFLALGLSAFVNATPDFTPPQFEHMAATLVNLRPEIRNVALAPNNVVRHVYPLKGNKQAIGLNYLENPAQREAVLRVMAEKKPVAAGPIQLVQGGEGLINRIPIYPHDNHGNPYYWGIASIVVDPAPLYAAAGLNDTHFTYALRGKDGKGARGAMILGDSTLFENPHSILMDVTVPGGTWQLAGRPVRSPLDADSRRNLRHGIGILLAIGCSISISLILGAHTKIRSLALHDPLTSIPNRRYLVAMAENQIALARRSGRRFSILHLDLDDFKKINDNFGHKAGDAILVHVAGQTRSALRESDFAARVGGDEFIVLLPDTDSGSGLHELIERLRAAITRPIEFEGQQLSVGVSIGSSTYHPDSGLELDQLVKEADISMYLEKQRHKEAA